MRVSYPLIARHFALLAATGVCLAFSFPAQAEEPAAPAQLYQKYCAVCHGKKGAGDSYAATGMTPPPADFTRPRALVDLTRESMIKTITEGRPGTAMVAWKGLLSDAQIGGVADYIRDTLMMSSGDDSASLGRRLFAKNCSVCHGDKGDTAVWARSGLTPSPRDFTSERSRTELTRDRMIFSVTYGRPETAMPAWQGRLTREEIEAVVDYVRNAFIFQGQAEQPKPQAGHGDGGQAGHQHNHFNPEDLLQPMPKQLTGDVAWGEKFYQDNCAVCHGKEGDGKGTRSDFIFPKPRNFLHPSSLHKFNRVHLFEVVSKGMPGTEMPAWDKVLSEQEIANVAEFVFQHFIQKGLELEKKKAPASQDAHAGHDAPQADAHAGHGAPQADDHTGHGAPKADDHAGHGAPKADEHTGHGAPKADDHAGHGAPQADDHAGHGAPKTDEHAGHGAPKADDHAGEHKH